MSNEIDELIRLVEADPSNHKQRWRLARKLYNAWDYRSAMEHLLILHEGWSDRLSVTRYLAATYFRLGRYDDAIRELTETLEIHKDDVALLELLARVYEGAGNRKKALETWRRALPISGSGEAQAAIERLEGTAQSMSTFDGTFDGSAASVKEALLICRYCGTLNELYSPRCPRCHAAIPKEGETDMASPSSVKTGSANLTWFVLGFSAVATTVMCVWAFFVLQ